MMFVHDAPPAINFAQTHRQSKFEGFTFAVRIDVDTPPSAVAKATSSPQVTSTSWKANETGFQPTRRTFPKK